MAGSDDNERSSREPPTGTDLVEQAIDYDPSQEPPHLVEGLIGDDQVLAMIGKPGAGKTTIAATLAVAIASGQKFFGREVRQGAVIYVGAEAPVGVRKRLTAAALEVGIPLVHLPIALIRQPVNLLDVEAVDRLIDGVCRYCEKVEQPARLIIFDTWARTKVGAEENDADATAMVLEAVDRIRAALRCNVLVLHHPSKADPRQSRGSTAFVGAIDGEIVAERQEGTNVGLILPGKPNRDLELFAPFTYDLKIVELGRAANDKLVTSVVAVAAEVAVEVDPKGAVKKRRPLTASQRRAYDLLVEAVNRHGEQLPADDHFPSGRRGVREEVWRVFCDKGGVTASVKPASRAQAFRRAAEALLAAGRVGKWEEWVWPIDR
jgi:putative DNA primase/helicase